MYRVEVTKENGRQEFFRRTWQDAKRIARLRSRLTEYGAIVYRPDGTELCRFYNGVER